MAEHPGRINLVAACDPASWTAGELLRLGHAPGQEQINAVRVPLWGRGRTCKVPSDCPNPGEEPCA